MLPFRLVPRTNLPIESKVAVILPFVTVAERIVWAEIDREARKGPPVPSDHAPVVIDLDEAGAPFEAGWDAALARIAARGRPDGRKSPAQVRYEEERAQRGS